LYGVGGGGRVVKGVSSGVQATNHQLLCRLRRQNGKTTVQVVLIPS